MMEFSDLNEDICADSWEIQSNEITQREFVRQTPRYNIYKADWFGDVLVYEPINSSSSSNHQADYLLGDELHELNELRLVAHETFMLFMGFAQTKNQQFNSLIMQINRPNTISLHNLLHKSKFLRSTSNSPLDRFFPAIRQPATGRTNAAFASTNQQLSLANKLNICQQVTNAMTYLHNKNINHGRLTSVNIYIEPNQRVKISLIDNDEQPIAAVAAESSNAKQNLGSPSPSPSPSSSSRSRSLKFNLPALTYLSPELIRTIKVISNQKDGKQQNKHERVNNDNNNNNNNKPVLDTAKLSKKSDIFSFGTLLFELFEERYPFSEPLKSDNPPLSLSPYSHQMLFASCTPLGFTTNNQSATQIRSDNINISASELIYQIGSGQIESRNFHSSPNNNAQSTDRQADQAAHYPTFVKHMISSCWLEEPSKRPDFKQLSFVNEAGGFQQLDQLYCY